MIGTIANTLTILTGSLVGSLLKRGIKAQYSDALFLAMGLAATAIGINSVVQNMPNSQYPVLFIASLAIGSLAGTILDIDGKFKALVDSFSRKEREPKRTAVQVSCSSSLGELKSNSATSAAAGSGHSAESTAPFSVRAAQNPLSEGLSTAILLFCIGTLSILGPIQAAVFGDHTFLFTNAMLDLVTSAVLASTYGIGIAIAAPVLFLWQGGIYLFAGFLSGFLSDALLCEISVIGGILIASSGISILKIREIKTLNLLPALFVPPLWFMLVSLLP